MWNRNSRLSRDCAAAAIFLNRQLPQAGAGTVQMGEPLVGIIMGSTSDWETMRHAAETLDALGVAHEVKVVSAHRTPEAALRLCRTRPRSAG